MNLGIVVRVLIVTSLMFSCVVLFGQSDFSAEIVNHEQKSPQTTKIFVTKDKMRIEGLHEGRSGTVIWDFDSGILDVIMPAQKMYMEIPQQQGMQGGFRLFRTHDVEDACGGWRQMAEKPGGSCRKVGHETVNGRTTVKYEGTSAAGDTGAFWIDTSLAFPLKWEDKGGGGELQNIQEGAQPASLFAIPAGYQKMDMGSMMQRGHQ